jgi:hypothetical protein
MNKNRAFIIFAGMMILLLGGQFTSPIQQGPLRQEIEELKGRGCSVRFVKNDIVEITEPSGSQQLMNLSIPRDREIRVWAASRGIPILEINPVLIDTTRYTGWYNHWQQVPIASHHSPPFVVADADGNGIPEMYGLVAVHTDVTRIETRIFEIDRQSFRFTYQPYPGIPIGIVDVDNDSLHEILFSGQSGVVLTDYSQLGRGTLPTTLNFTHLTSNTGGTSGFMPPYVGMLDQDSLVDCLYKVTEADSADSSWPFFDKVAFAEYDPTLRNLRRVWASRIYPDDVLGPFAVADFDGDGKCEFVTTGGLVEGNVFLYENTGDNSYALTYQDNTPFVNLYRSTSGDVDGDGKPEFFVVATIGTQWATMYEADSNDHYSPKLLLHFLSGGTIDFPTYIARDIDGDEQLELLTTSGSHIFIFKSDRDNSYRLWYYKREDRLDAVQVFDFNKDEKMDLVISKFGTDSLGRARYYSDLYASSHVMAVDDAASIPRRAQLFSAYPNPFNSSTVIQYELSETQRVQITILDLIGQTVASIADETQHAGHHSVRWDATSMTSGMYFCRLQIDGVSLTKKLLLIR